jgi:hypothetical protein
VHLAPCDRREDDGLGDIMKVVQLEVLLLHGASRSSASCAEGPTLSKSVFKSLFSSSPS